MVGVNMGRHTTHQAVKLLHLSAEFAAHGWDITDIELAFSFAPDIPMQPYRQPRTIMAHGHRFMHSAPCHHETGACDHPTGITFQNASVQTTRSPKIVGIDSEVFGHLSPLGLTVTDFILGQTKVCEQPSRHFLRREVLFRKRPCRLTVSLIVRVDGLNSRQRLSHRGKSEEALARRDDVAKPCILRHDWLPRGEITGVPFTEPAAA